MKDRSPQDLRPDDLLGERFRLVRRVGQGAMGQVWLAQDTHLDDEPVACKLLTGCPTPDRRAIAYLKREVLLTRRLRHPHIVAVYTFWDADGLYFITMQYVPGRNLSELLADRDSLFAIVEVLPWLRQISEALDYAHGQGVLHRDIKPANMILGQDGQAWLADFGIARTVSDMRNRMSGGVTCGTVMFMSPEQLLGEKVGAQSDIYSLGASTYELLAGIPPFYSGSIVAQIQRRPAPCIEHLPAAINDVLRRTLSKDPCDRPASCKAFCEELAAAARYLRRGDAALPTGLRRVRATAAHDADTVLLEGREDGPPPGRLGVLLTEAGAITPAQLEEALRTQEQTQERLGDILRRLGYLDETAMARTLAHQLQIPLIALEHEHFDPALTGLVGPGFARGRRCLPVRRIGDRVVAAMADPLDLGTLNLLEAICGSRADLRIATESDILATTDRIYGPP